VDNEGTPATLSVTVVDGKGGSFVGSVVITPVNPTPDAVDDTQALQALTDTKLDLLKNDTDPDGDPLTATVATLADPTKGTLTQNPDKSWSFKSAKDVVGPVVVNYTIVDQDGASDTATHTLQVNGPPVLFDPDPKNPPTVDPLDPTKLLVPATDNVPLTLDLDEYFSDPNGDPLTLTVDLSKAPAWVKYDPATGVVSGTPPVDNEGTPATLSVTVVDGKGGSFVGSVVIAPVNPAPDAVEDKQAVSPETLTLLTLLANDADPDGDPLTVTAKIAAADAAKGTLTQNPDGSWSFKSAAGVNGPVLIEYTIVDQDGASDTATHTLDVANQPPDVFDPDPKDPTTPGIDPLNPTNLVVPGVDNVPFSINLKDYYTDPNTGDVLTITIDLNDIPTWATLDTGTGILKGTPPVDNAGSSVIPVTVTDGKGGVFNGTITLAPVNPGPDAKDETQNVPATGPTPVTFLANDTDPDGDPLTVTVATLVDPSKGTLTQNPDKSWTFEPAKGVNGPVEINYTVTDQDGATDTAKHTLNVANRPPTLDDPDPTPDTPSVDPGDPNRLLVPGTDNVPVFVNLKEYFTDPNTADILTFTVNLTGVPPWVTYDPATGRLGGTPPVDNTGVPVDVPVTVDDGKGGSVTSTIRFNPVNPPPVARDQTVASVEGVPVVLDLLGNDSDPDGDPISVQGTPTLNNPASGTIALVDGSWVFTPAAGFSGDAVVTYSIVDQDGGVSTATHTVSVPTPPAPAPEPEPEPVPEPEPEDPTPNTPDAPKVELPPNVEFEKAKESLLFVLPAVSKSNTERALASAPLGALQAEAPLVGEGMAQVADNLLFDNSNRPEAVALIQERPYGAMANVPGEVYVQRSVRYEPLPQDNNIWVQKSVRASQLESLIRTASLDANTNSASAGYSTLIDAFALGAPRWPEDVFPKTAEADIPEPAKQAAEAPPAKAKPAEEAPQVAKTKVPVEPPPAKPQAAAGLRSQLERIGKERPQAARAVTRSTVNS
jgi:large repetitive protein